MMFDFLGETPVNVYINYKKYGSLLGTELPTHNCTMLRSR